MIIVLDCETTNSLEDPIVYDVGFAVVDPWTGRVYEKHSYVNIDVFADTELMASAFFADKILQYQEEIKNGTRKAMTYFGIKCQLRECCKRWNIQVIAAHNARFDYCALTKTERYQTSSKSRFFIPYGIELWDTLAMSRKILGNDSDYLDFCAANEYTTKNGKPRFTAEIIYRYLTGDNDFTEEHTGLADVLIEAEIFTYCLNRNPRINGKLW